MTTLPVVTGFGIANQQIATQALHYTDGFIIASLCVRVIAEGITRKVFNCSRTINGPREKQKSYSQRGYLS